MAIAFGGALGSNTNKATGTTVTLTTGAAVPIGALVVVIWAADNLTATTPTLASVTDTKSNTYTVVANVGSGTATANAGQVAGIAVSRITTALTASDTISAVASSASTVVKVVDAAYFRGATVTTRAAATTATGNSTAPSVTYASGQSGDLLIGVVGNQSNALPTGDSDTTNGTWGALGGVASTGGSAAANISGYGQYKILTATGSQTYNVTITSGQWSIAAVALTPAPTTSRTATDAGTGTQSATGLRKVLRTSTDAGASSQIAFRNVPPVGINWSYWGTNSMVPAAIPVDFLVVAGGGGGGSGTGGGGGGGGYRSSVTGELSGGGAAAEAKLSCIVGTQYTVTVGGGGAKGAGSLYFPGSNGTDSVFGSITSTGGGGGGSNQKADLTGSPAPSGGSGGGGGAAYPVGGSTTGGSATASQGYAGGNGKGQTNYPTGGGGGAGSVGETPATTNSNGGAGGAGVTSSINGTATGRAGGGGGGIFQIGTGGSATDGGSAGVLSGTAANATANRGGGGGGGGANGSNNGGNGGSGYVAIRYQDTYPAAAATTGSPTITVSGGWRIYEWTGSGSITF